MSGSCFGQNPTRSNSRKLIIRGNHKSNRKCDMKIQKCKNITNICTNISYDKIWVLKENNGKRSVPFIGPIVTIPDPCISDNIPNHHRICTSVVQSSQIFPFLQLENLYSWALGWITGDADCSSLGLFLLSAIPRMTFNQPRTPMLNSQSRMDSALTETTQAIRRNRLHSSSSLMTSDICLTGLFRLSLLTASTPVLLVTRPSGHHLVNSLHPPVVRCCSPSWQWSRASILSLFVERERCVSAPVYVCVCVCVIIRLSATVMSHAESDLLCMPAGWLS